VDPDLLTLAVDLRRTGEAFALATVVRCERPTSAKPGAKALIRGDGRVTGWVGGACAEPLVVREALDALRDGEPRLIALVGEGGQAPGRTEGLVLHAMTCHSGGTLEIYIEPFLPKPLLAIVGHGPVVEALAALGRATDLAVVALGPETTPADLGRLSLGATSSVVVATHGSGDEEALRHALGSGAGYVSLIASRRRAAAVMENLTASGLSVLDIARIKAPAGMDIGAVTPAEIAVSILAEIVQRRRGDKPRPMPADEGPAAEESRDPVCGMTVTIATAPYRSDGPEGPVYFCCPGCKQAFDRDPHRYAGLAAG
jgi:xanthine dehydrogenase accessory factor